MNNTGNTTNVVGEILRSGEDELLSSSSYATAFYAPSVLQITVGPDLALDEAVENAPASRLPLAIGTHAHEYVHYLHNIGTCAGLRHLCLNTNVLVTVHKMADQDGRILGSSNLNDEWKEYLAQSIGQMRDHRGRNLGAKIINSCRGALNLTLVDVSQDQSTTPTHKFRIEIPDPTSSEPSAIEVDIGYNLITEGVAFEVERLIYSHHASVLGDVSSQTPRYPYRFYGELVDFLVGRQTTAQERVSVGNIALGTYPVTHGLATACAALKSQHNVDEKFADYHKRALENARELLKAIEVVLDASPVDSQTRTGFNIYLELIKRALHIKSTLPIPELLFTESKLDIQSYQTIIGQLVDVLIIQKRPNSVDGTYQNDDMYIIGPGEIVTGDATIGCLAMVQSAFQFLNQHIVGNDLTSTDNIGERECRYAGACPLSDRNQSDSKCMKHPWERMGTFGTGQACWYVAGMLMMRPAEPGVQR